MARRACSASVASCSVLASAACALAPSPAWLITARVVQGAAAAIVTPASLALIGATYPRAERNRAIGVWAAASALTTAGGPVVGGWLTETFGWPSVFWINPPLALVAVGILLVFAPKDALIQRRFDVIGAAILALALGALAWALSQIGASEDGPPRTHQPSRARSSRSSPGSALSGSPSTRSGKVQKRASDDATPPGGEPRPSSG